MSAIAQLRVLARRRDVRCPYAPNDSLATCLIDRSGHRDRQRSRPPPQSARRREISGVPGSLQVMLVWIENARKPATDPHLMSLASARAAAAMLVDGKSMIAAAAHR
jgi:hypothetical protein